MSDDNDKKVDAKVEGVDTSGYMPPGLGPGPVSPYPPGPVSPYPPGPCVPECPDKEKDMSMYLAGRLKALMGQQVTVYVMGLGPLAPIPVVPTGGILVAGSGPAGITGMLHYVGADYITLHVDLANTRVVYIPMMAISAVVPGGPLEPNVEPNVVTTAPQVTL